MTRACTADWSSERVLVTGASGFIGRAVCLGLHDLGAQVHGTGRTRPPPDFVEPHQASLPEDAQTLLAEVRPTCVVHLASPIRMDHTDSARAELSRGIVDATDAIAQAARTHRCHLVHISSCAVYETGQAPFAETDSLHPSSPYGQLKLDAEAALRSHQRHGLRATVLRPFRTYGPGCTEGLIAEACEAALESAPLRLTQGSQVREWNHVDAIAAGIIWAVGARPVGDVLNLGGGPRSSVFEIARRVYALANADADLIQRGARPARPGAIPRFWGDLRRLESRRGPLPHTALQTGLRQTLEWHRAQRSVAR